MMEIKVILCPIDFSEFSIRAYVYARSVAEHYGAKLVVQHVVEISRYPFADYAASTGDYAEFCQTLHNGATERLQAFLKAHGDDSCHPGSIVQEGTAPDCILSCAEKCKADLIVIGTHGRRGYDRVVLGSVTNRVMRRTSCPVLAICTPQQESIAEAHDGKHTHQLRRILFCTDFSENSERAFRYALSAADEYNAELIVLHVLDESRNSSRVQTGIATATEQLDKMIPQKIRKSLKTRTVVRVGKPYQQIIEFATETKTDTIVMGVRGRGAVDLAVFGSTTYRVLQLGPCPVLAVHV